ncbi:MAG TPA: VTT domain-containing protein [Pirellulales bacterium]|jgi:membrane-associated protein|nr:VTT domain-containing protein [Pirellulales bacterium]
MLLDFIRWLIGLAKPENLRQLVSLGGPIWISYLILMAIVFSETGLLVGFFLPGDSMLFAAGFLCSQHVFDIGLLIAALSLAAIVGDAVNYYLGLQMEERVFEKGRLRFVKHEHLLAAKAFYERHGGKAIVLARFAPLIRTFTPFVAGVGRMGYRRFAIFNIAGGIGWVATMSLAGYWLGRIKFVSEHFEHVIILIVFVSLLPIAISFFRAWRGHKIELHAASPSDG